MDIGLTGADDDDDNERRDRDQPHTTPRKR
jgi:hypothetical protein